MNKMRLQVSAKSSQCVSNLESAYRHTHTHTAEQYNGEGD